MTDHDILILLLTSPDGVVKKAGESSMKYIFEILEEDGLVIKTPTLIELWQEYRELPNEDHRMYEKLKRMFINAFGEKWFDYYLHSTTFFHQIWWLGAHGQTTEALEGYRI